MLAVQSVGRFFAFGLRVNCFGLTIQSTLLFRPLNNQFPAEFLLCAPQKVEEVFEWWRVSLKILQGVRLVLLSLRWDVRGSEKTLRLGGDHHLLDQKVVSPPRAVYPLLSAHLTNLL